MKRLTSWLIVVAMAITPFVPVCSVYAEAVNVENSTVVENTEQSITAPEESVVSGAAISPTQPSATPESIIVSSSDVQSIPQNIVPVDPTTVEIASLNVVPQPIVLPASPIIITGYQASGGRLNFVQIYNNSSDLLATGGWAIRYTANNEEFEFDIPDAWLLSKKYAVFAWTGQSLGADAEYSFNSVTESGSVVSIELLPPVDLFAKVSTSLPANYNDTRMQRYTSPTTGNYTTTATFSSVADTLPLFGDGLYVPPINTDVRVAEILPNSKNCSPMDDDLACGDYIKLFNPTDQAIELNNLRLRNGYRGQSSGTTNTVSLEGVLPAGEYATIAVRDDSETITVTNTGGYVWVEDAQGLVVYEPTVVEYPDSSADKSKGQSWAFDTAGSAWKWGIPSPYGANYFAETTAAISVSTLSSLMPCRDDQYRSEETNRCRNLTPTSTQALCKEGQYRNEETGRCRNVSVTAGLALCRDDQYRSEETNRCRNVVTASSVVKPCKDDQYRSEETNRCRNVVATSVPEAAFAVETIADTGEVFLGWWALGGVGLLALGYAGWEWRSEFMYGVRKLGSFFTSGK